MIRSYLSFDLFFEIYLLSIRQPINATIVPSMIAEIRTPSCKRKLSPRVAKRPSRIQEDPQHNKARNALKPPAPRKRRPILLFDFCSITTLWQKGPQAFLADAAP